MLSKVKNLGPGVLVSAAFIGPGTVTTSTLAGANFGTTLLWALIFATFATIFLQEMSARLGTITGKGLGEALIDTLDSSICKWPMLLLIITALCIGNAAYEGGNIAGAVLGASALVGEEHKTISTLMIAGVSTVVLILGSYKMIERALITLVILMALAFVATFIAIKPDLNALISQALSISMPNDKALVATVALIGTTVVPYNLFLHASAATKRWRGKKQLSEARGDTILSIGLGGLIAILIMSTAASSLFSKGLVVNNAADMAQQLEPLFGVSAKYMMGLGLLAAGLSSAITAPLATGLVMTEVFKFENSQRSLGFKFVALSILWIGTTLTLLGWKPLNLILMAQFANRLLLPIVAGFLLFVANQTKVMGDYRNGWMANALGCLVLVFTLALGIKSIITATGSL